MECLFYTGVISGKMILNTEVTVINDRISSRDIDVKILGKGYSNIHFSTFNIKKIPFPPEFHRRAALFNEEPSVDKIGSIVKYLYKVVKIPEKEMTCGVGDESKRPYLKLLKSVCGITTCSKCPIRSENISKVCGTALTKEQKAAIFMAFLEKNKCKEKYLHNFKDQKLHKDAVADFLHENRVNSYISNAFTWNMTPEGYTFWDDLSTKWQLFKKTA